MQTQSIQINSAISEGSLYSLMTCLNKCNTENVILSRKLLGETRKSIKIFHIIPALLRKTLSPLNDYVNIILPLLRDSFAIIQKEKKRS